jgi:tetratricopeptide (TPR) repeat protein
MASIQMYKNDWAGADASCKRALALEPGDASVVRRAGLLAQCLGHFDDAIANYRRATQIDPLNPEAYWSLGFALYYAGRHEEAKVDLRKALELAPDFASAHFLLALVFLEQVRPEEALAEVEKEKHSIWRQCGLVLVYHALGRNKESDANLTELIAERQADAQYQIAEMYAFRGDKDRAFEWLKRSYKEHDPALRSIKGDPLLKSLERDSRYSALLKRMHLPF